MLYFYKLAISLFALCAIGWVAHAEENKYGAEIILEVQCDPKIDEDECEYAQAATLFITWKRMPLFITPQYKPFFDFIKKLGEENKEFSMLREPSTMKEMMIKSAALTYAKIMTENISVLPKEKNKLSVKIISKEPLDMEGLKSFITNQCNLSFHEIFNPGEADTKPGNGYMSLENPAYKEYIYIKKESFLPAKKILKFESGSYDNFGNLSHYIHVDSEGQNILYNFTKNNIGKSFAILLNNKILSTPVIMVEINNRSMMLSVGMPIEDAAELELCIGDEPLPFPVIVVEEDQRKITTSLE